MKVVQTDQKLVKKTVSEKNNEEKGLYWVKFKSCLKEN